DGRAREAATVGARLGGGWGGAIIPRFGALWASGHAPHLPDGPVEPDDIGGAGGFVKTVDLLRHEREARKAPAPRGQHVVRAIGPALGDEAAAPVVPLPDGLGIPRERRGRSQLLGAEPPPQAGRRAE